MRKLALFFILMLMPISILAQVYRERYFPAIRTDGKITSGDTLISLKGLRINGNIRGFKGTFSDTLVTLRGIRSEGPSLLKGKVTGNDTLVAIKGLRVEGPSLLKGKVTGNDTLVAIKGLRVEGPSLLKGKVTGNDTLVATKGFRSEGPIRVKDVSTFGATATPLQILTTGDIRSLSTAGHRLRMDGIGATFAPTKSLLLENQAAAGAGAQQMSPALQFKGFGWKTDATAASDSVKWAIYNLPVQGTSAPTTTLYFDSKIGSSAWSNAMKLSSSKYLTGLEGLVSNQGTINYLTTKYISSAAELYFSADYNDSGSDGVIAFGRNGTSVPVTEYARFTHAGNLGIGTTAPGTKLGQAQFSADALGSYHSFDKSRHATAGSHTIVQDNDAIGGLQFRPSDGTDFGTVSAQIKAEVDDAAPAASSIGGALVFSTAAGVGADDLTERMRIDKDGNVVRSNATQYVKVVSLADGAQHILPIGVAGFGRVYCGTEYATFTFTSAGVVTIVAAGTAGLTSANVTTIEDNDATLNIFDDGSGIGIENELGSTYNTLIDITYYTP